MPEEVRLQQELAVMKSMTAEEFKLTYGYEKPANLDGNGPAQIEVDPLPLESGEETVQPYVDLHALLKQAASDAIERKNK